MNMTAAQMERFVGEYDLINLKVRALNVKRCTVFGITAPVVHWFPQKDFIQVVAQISGTGERVYYNIPHWVLNLDDLEAIQDHFVREKINGVR